MESKKKELLDFLALNKIEAQIFHHPPIFSCEEEKLLIKEHIPGVSTKNLFLVNERGEHYLVVVSCEKKVAINALRKTLGFKKLSFGSAEKMFELLAVTPGAVTVLGLLFDLKRQIKVILDEEINTADFLKCHPLDNAMTAVISRDGIGRFFNVLGVVFDVVVVPERLED